MPLHPLPPVEVSSRTSRVLDVLADAILNGELAPGDTLVESELATRLGVSKTPVREALKTLQGRGLVVIRPYVGASVRVLSEQDALDVYDLRALIEPEAVRRCVAAGTDLTAAEQALERATTAADASHRSLANRDFHRALYAGCDNDLLVRSLDDLRDQTALVATASWARRPSWEREAAEHAAILAAARAGDPGETARLLREHIDGFIARQIRGTGPVTTAAPASETGVTPAS